MKIDEISNFQPPFLNDIQKELLIDDLILTLLCLEDKNLYELSILSSIDYIKETIKHEH